MKKKICLIIAAVFLTSLVSIDTQASVPSNPGFQQSLAIPYRQTAALKSDGTVVVTKNTYYKTGLPDTSKWKNIVQIDAGDFCVYGLKSDGTVVASGGTNEKGQRNVENWTDVVQICAGYDFCLGLKSDGTVLYAGDKNWGQDEVLQWKNIKKLIVTGYTVIIGIDTDGIIHSTGYTSSNRDVFKRAFANWTDIVDIVILGPVAVGLRTDGTIVTVGEETDDYYIDRTKVGSWKNIVQIEAGFNHVIGLKADGTVVAAGRRDFRNYGQLDVSGWKNIREIAAGDYYSLGLKSDGTLLFKGDNTDGQGKITGWKNIKIPDKKQLSPARKMVTYQLNISADGKPVVSKAKPYFDSLNRTMVPVKPVSEALGATVSSSGSSKLITTASKNRKIKFTNGKKEYWVNDLFMKMEISAVTKDGELYVPADILSQALVCDMDYDPVTKKVIISPIRRESIPYTLEGAKAFTGKTEKVGPFITPDFRESGFSIYKSSDERIEVKMSVNPMIIGIDKQINALANTLIQKVDESVVRQIIDHIMPKITAYTENKDRTYKVENAIIYDPKSGRCIEIEESTFDDINIDYCSDSYSKRLKKILTAAK